MTQEKRTLSFSGAEVRAAGEFCIVAKALSYNKPSPDDQLAPGVREMIAPGCFTESIKAGGYQGDVRALFNHASDNVLGRLKNGTLTLMDGPDALRFRVQLNRDSQAHKDIYALVQRGDIDNCSFAFRSTQDEFIEDTDSKGQKCLTRVLRKADLIDVSIVTFPFYSNNGSTDAQVRALDGKLSVPSVDERVKTLRRAAQSFAKRCAGLLRGDDDALVNFASRMDRCHEYAEFSHSQLCAARDAWDDDEELDEMTRAYFRGAIAHSNMLCDRLAEARLAHAKNKKK